MILLMEGILHHLMWFITLLTVFYTSQVVQNFFHLQYFTNLLEKSRRFEATYLQTRHHQTSLQIAPDDKAIDSSIANTCDFQEPSKTHVVQDSCLHDCQDTSLPDTCLWLPLLVPAMQKTSKQCAHFEASNLKRSSKKTTLLVDFLHIRWNRRTGPFLPMSFFPTKIREVANGTHLSDLRSFPALRTRNLDNFR